MRVETDYVDVIVAGRPMRTFVAAPADGLPHPGIAFYSDIFQLTDSTLRWVSRLASYGFVVAAPEIYYRIEEPGTVLAFDDAGKDRGQADVSALSAAQFDEDIAALLSWLAEHPRVDSSRFGAAGHCTGGHLAFRAALQPSVAATACWYPTGLADGVLGSDADAGSLQRVGEVTGALLLIFGGSDPHTSADSRAAIREALDVADARYEWHVVPGAEHAFGRDVGPRWDPSATDEAFAETVDFFNANLSD